MLVFFVCLIIWLFMGYMSTVVFDGACYLVNMPIITSTHKITMTFFGILSFVFALSIFVIVLVCKLINLCRKQK